MNDQSAQGGKCTRGPSERLASPADKKQEPAWRHSPFADEEIGLAAKAPAFVDGIAQAMVWDAGRHKDYLLGQLLASAIIHGALLCEHFWQPWLDRLGNSGGDGELLWVEIRPQDEEASTYRWFADQTTRSLILLWQKLDYEAQGASAIDCLGTFLGEIPGAPDEQQDSIDAFITWAVMYWRLRLPPLLLDQALSRLPTVGMSYGTWRAVLGRRHRPVKGARYSKYRTERSALDVTRQWLAAFKDNGSIESAIFEEGWRLRSKGVLTQRQEKNFCVRQLKAALPTLTPGRQLLVCWAINCLTRPRARPSPKGLAASTVRQRLCSILEGVYPNTYQSPDFGFLLADLDQDVGEMTDGAESVLIKAAHKDFCAFLDDQGGVRVKAQGGVRVKEGEEEELEEALEQSADSNLNPPTTVSAKVVSPSVYATAVGIARSYPNEQAALTIILGFRAGLRFSEISGLQVHDFVIREKDILELHLRRHRHRELKTFESRRIIPLDVLLTAAEQDALRIWLEPRREFALKNETNAYCFGPLGSRKPLADREAYIEEILARACVECKIQQQYYTFAHLRHSFGSYLLATLMLPEDADRSLLPGAFADVVSRERKDLLSARLLGEERLGRSALHAVSQIMGHTGVYRTLESYQHLLDLVLGLYVNRRAIRPLFPPEVRASFQFEREEESANVMAGFSRLFRRTRQRSQDYIVPFPPKCLASPMVNENSAWLPALNAPAGSNDLEDRAEPPPKYYSANSPRNLCLAAEASTSKVRSDWKVVWTILTSNGDETEKLRALIGLDDKTFDVWQDRYGQILRSCFKRQTERRGDGRALPGPLGADALWVVNRMWLNYAKTLQKMRAPLLLTFLSNFDESASHSRFVTKEDAVEFARFLTNVGVNGRNITIARGEARDLKKLKSGELTAHPEEDDEGVVYQTWAASEAFLQKRRSDHRFALWISHKKHEETSIGWTFDVARHRRLPKRDADDGPIANNKVNYAYRFAIAMMAIVSDEVWHIEGPAAPHGSSPAPKPISE